MPTDLKFIVLSESTHEDARARVCRLPDPVDDRFVLANVDTVEADLPRCLAELLAARLARDAGGVWGIVFEAVAEQTNGSA